MRHEIVNLNISDLSYGGNLFILSAFVELAHF